MASDGADVLREERDCSTPATGNAWSAGLSSKCDSQFEVGETRKDHTQRAQHTSDCRNELIFMRCVHVVRPRIHQFITRLELDRSDRMVVDSCA